MCARAPVCVSCLSATGVLGSDWVQTSAVYAFFLIVHEQIVDLNVFVAKMHEWLVAGGQVTRALVRLLGALQDTQGTWMERFEKFGITRFVVCRAKMIG